MSASTPGNARIGLRWLIVLAGTGCGLLCGPFPRANAGGSEGVYRVPEQVPARFEAAPLSAQRLGGLLGERMRTNLVDRLLRIDESGLLDGFRHRPGKQVWIGEHVGKFLDAAARTWLYTRDERVKTLMDRVAHELISTQAEDGYLGTYTNDQRWTEWDVWVHKYDLLGLLAHHQATGDPRSLVAATKIGDLMVRTFGTGQGQRDIVAAGTHQGMAATSILGPMVALYRITGEARYLAFCRYVVAAMESPRGPRIVSGLSATKSVFKTANAKAYEMLSNLNGLVDFYALTGESQFLQVAVMAWQDITRHRLYVTGTTSSKEFFQGDNVLPGEIQDLIGETCVTVNWIELNLRLFRLSGDARYADELERSVYNHLLGAQDARNGDFCYYTPLNGKKPYGHSISCCVSSGPRGLSLLPAMTWGRLDDGIGLVLMTDGRATIALGKTVVTMTTQTRFPSDGHMDVRITARGPLPAGGAFPIFIRVPGWTTGLTVADGQLTSQGVPGTFLRVNVHSRETHLVVDMEMPVHILTGGPTYPDRVALQRGPQVMALDTGLNVGLEHPNLVALALAGGAVSLHASSAGARGGQSAYTLRAQIVDDAGAVHLQDVTVVPFADARSPRVWLVAPDRLAQVWSETQADNDRRPRALANQAATHVTVDGLLDEAGWHIQTSLGRVVRGTKQNRVQFGVLWDAHYLYVGVRVVDAQVTSYGPDSSNADSVDIAIQVPSGDVIHVVETADDTGFLPNTPLGPPGTLRAAKRSPDGYDVEVAVPWTALGLQPRVGLILPFDLCNTDSQPPPRKRNKLTWASPTEDMGSAGPEHFGRLVLSTADAP